jgi:hypothetical protein
VGVREHLFRSAAGIDHFLRHESDGSLHMESHQDVQHILDANKAMATHNDGYSPDRTMRRVARIPMILLMKWQAEEGWDPFAEENGDKLAAKLDSSEYQYLRTAPGRVGKQHRHT